MSMVDELGIAHAETPDGALTAFARRAPRISQADVFHAADELLLEGHRPTIDRVRMRLGRGSPNTINDHLDDWWAKLGSRLRDVPGHEFPQLPERIARTLQQLWNEALEGARDALQGTLREQEHALTQREQHLESMARQLAEREQATAVRATALEESLAIAREQLSVANRRAETLEATLVERDVECARLRVRIEALEASGVELRREFDTAAATSQAERSKLQAHYAASEARWLAEVDRARQATKDAVQDHELLLKELRGRIASLEADRDELRDELIETRSDLKTATALREQLEERLRTMSNSAVRGPRKKRSRKPKETTSTIKKRRQKELSA